MILPRAAYGKEITDEQQPLLLHRPKAKRMPVKRGHRGGATEASYFIAIHLID